MNTNIYTSDMTKLATIVAAVLAFLMVWLSFAPATVHAKAQGDTIGAPKATVMTGAASAKLNAIDAPVAPARVYSTEVSKTTHKLTKSEKRAAIRELKAEIKRLQKEVKRLSK